MNAYSKEEIASIIEKYGDMIYRTAFVQVKTRDLADDIFQEVCMRLVRQRERIDGEEHQKAWLIRATIHCCRDYWRSAWHRKITFAEPDEDEAAPQEGGTGGWVTQCVQDLPEKYRMVIYLYYYEQYSLKEIAQILNLNENTVASRLSRGRGKLKKMLEQEGGSYYEV